ncbi:tetratricopeptide repeat protein [Campylobacter sp. MIT 12-8780]|uniref:tetratricopeptide repeat protein n=1 Tax=Campylobacter sp. MIT 12-8780 TaxID=2202200 RepID=UPI001C8D0519|nr:tetratricopeptide repeat protein [Campylobacter sp. MIT 12-8780]
MKKFVFILFLLCGINLLWAYDSKDEFMQCENKDKQACKRLISHFEPRCNDKSLSKEVRGYACSVVGAAYSNNNEYREAASFFQKGCDLGHGFGCGKIARLYGLGEGVKQDFKKSFAFAQKGCDLNDAVGCVILGALYENGDGVKQNKAKAKEYYGKACDLGEQLGCDSYKRLNSR